MKTQLYDCTGKFQVLDSQSLRSHLLREGMSHYIYILCFPPLAKEVRPFYIGIGQGERIFSHEREAESNEGCNQKLQTIRNIKASGQDVLRFLDGVFPEAPR